MIRGKQGGREGGVRIIMQLSHFLLIISQGYPANNIIWSWLLWAAVILSGYRIKAWIRLVRESAELCKGRQLTCHKSKMSEFFITSSQQSLDIQSKVSKEDVWPTVAWTKIVLDFVFQIFYLFHNFIFTAHSKTSRWKLKNLGKRVCEILFENTSFLFMILTFMEDLRKM